MAPEKTEKVCKYDPNTEAFQMRAQWHKAEICKQQWAEKWSWLLDEQKKSMEEADAIRQAANIRKVHTKTESLISLKPVPLSSNRMIGWLAGRPDCRLEIYTSWTLKPPVRLPDAWQNSEYLGHKSV